VALEVLVVELLTTLLVQFLEQAQLLKALAVEPQSCQTTVVVEVVALVL
jgi:hypothetical protein